MRASPRRATLAEALAGAAWVQENAPEDLAIKQALWRDLDALADPDTILASSTSAIVPSRFTESLAGRARCLTCHPINPPYLIPAVELVPVALDRGRDHGPRRGGDARASARRRSSCSASSTASS